ncbi:MAG: ABC transporter substrate-binding protein, partial [Candidatus Bathyarchaeia archaeon]
AEEEGWFSERNLDVTIVYADSEREALDMIASGKANFAFASAENVITARANGVPVRAVMQIYKNNPNGIAVTEGSATVEGLEGKRIGIPYDASEFYIQSLIAENNINDKVTLVTLDYSIRQPNPSEMADALNQQVDGIMLWATDVPLLKKEGVDAEFLSLSSYGLNYPSIALVVSDSFMEEQEEVMLRTLNPIAKGLKWTVFSEASATRVLSESAPATYGDHDVTVPVTRSVRELIMSGAETKSDVWGLAPVENYAGFLQFMTERGVLTTPLLAEDVTAVNDKIIAACTVSSAPA